MAFFKFRKSGEEPAAAPVPAESIEVMRQRAKHRLLGAVLLVLLGVVGFPLLFDKQPRPISVDIPIEIPDRGKVKPLVIPEPVAAPKVEEAPTAPAAPPVSEPSKPAPKAEPASETPKAIEKIAPAMAEKPVEKPIDKTVAAPPKIDDGGKAQALLDGKEPEHKDAAAEGRFVVQVGAYADAARAHDVRLKLEHAGLKTYTQVVDTKDGRRIRVRVGPFAGKPEADKAAAKIKKLSLPATTLSL
jgi:DedD protein